MKSIIFILLIVAIYSCGPKEYCDYIETEKVISFFIVDATNKESLLSDLNGPFNSNTIVKDEFGDIVPLKTKNGLQGGLFKILIAESGKDSLETLIRKTYYIHLAQGSHSDADIDTLLLWYKIVPHKCKGGIDVKELNCKYNDSLYVYNYCPTTGSEARFIKKGY